ncbi:MAG: 3'-5' exoribonuclease [Thermoguttaceae bacterium]|nr:3'-5' exoribonuclease [Thermoguttaceae bacterium]
MSIFVIIDGQKTPSTPAKLKELAYANIVEPTTPVEIDNQVYPAAAIRFLAEYFLAAKKLVEFPPYLDKDDDEEMEFVFVDVETPNGKHDSICSIGIVTDDGKTFESLVHTDAEFNPYSVKVHGITASDVVRAPKFREIWANGIHEIASKVIVAYNAPVDVSAIQHALRADGLAPPPLAYIDVLSMAREALSLKSYSLESVCAELDIPFDNHHNALADAIACRAVFATLVARGIFCDVLEAKFDEFHYADTIQNTAPAKPTNAQIAEKQAFYGILNALCEYGNDAAQKALDEWRKRNASDATDVLDRYRNAADQIISTQFSKQALNASRIVAQEVAFPSLAAFVYYLDAIGNLRTNEVLEKLLDALEALEPKEQPGNTKQLKKKLKNALTSPETLPELEIEIHRTLRPFDFALTDANQIAFQGKTFVLSGAFVYGKPWLEEKLENTGAEIHKNPKATTDYLVVGGPDDAWKLGTHGGTKIIKAVGIQANGGNLQLIFEKTLLEALGATEALELLEG